MTKHKQCSNCSNDTSPSRIKYSEIINSVKFEWIFSWFFHPFRSFIIVYIRTADYNGSLLSQ